MGQTSEILIIITIGAPPNAAKDNAVDIRVEVGAPLSRGRRQTPGLNKRCSPNDSYASPSSRIINYIRAIVPRLETGPPLSNTSNLQNSQPRRGTLRNSRALPRIYL